MGCCGSASHAGSTENKLRLEIELHKARAANAEAQAKLAQLNGSAQLGGSRQLNGSAQLNGSSQLRGTAGALVRPGYLTPATVQVDMLVRVTDNWERFKSNCIQTRLDPEERRDLLGESCKVRQVDHSDSTCQVKWHARKRWVPVASLQQLAPGAPTPSDEDSEPDQADLLLGLLRRLVDDSGSQSLPAEPFDPAKGFHLFYPESSVTIDGTKTVAKVTRGGKRSVITCEVVPPSASCDFMVRLTGPSKGPMGFGVTSQQARGFKEHVVAEAGFDSSGAVCRTNAGVFAHNGRQVGDAPGLRENDVVGVRLRNGAVEFVREGQSFYSCGIGGGDLRFVVSFTAEGQSATVVSSSFRAAEVVEDGHLKRGSRVVLPNASDRRLHNMRVKWNTVMSLHCGRVGQVVEVRKKCVKVNVDTTSYLWDLEVFDRNQKRYCHEGCDLVAEICQKAGRLCDCCMTLQPKGATTTRCAQHNYDLCEYCCGASYAPQVGSRVIRGPTWQWDNQDGQRFGEGVVQSAPDSEGWLSVKWDHTSKTDNYRGPPYQDVMLARENGLEGEMDGHQALLDLVRLMEQLKQGTKGGDMDASQLPRVTYEAAKGFHFWRGLKSIKVDEAKRAAECVDTRKATAVTEEVLNGETDTCEFAVKIRTRAGDFSTGSVLVVGMVDDNPRGFSQYPIGHNDFKGSLGAMCDVDGGAIVHDGKIVGEAPGIQDDDVVSIRVSNGRAEFLHNGASFHSVGLQGQFRMGVSLCKQGQKVEIVDPSTVVDIDQVPTLGLLTCSMVPQDVPRLTWGKDLQVDTRNPRNSLGKGGFGETWKGRVVSDGGSEEVAVKLLHQQKLTQKFKQDFQAEVGALAALVLPGGEPHPFLLRLVAIVPEKYGIVTELCLYDLEKHVETQFNSQTKKQMAELMRHVAVGMSWLAEREYVHRDLKMQNILIAKSERGDYKAKIADFGLARKMKDTEGQVAGTIVYMAPEAFEGHCSQKTDVYSFAFIMLHTFNGKEVDIMAFLLASALAGLMRGKKASDFPALVEQAVKSGERPKIPSSLPNSARGWIEAAWQGEPSKRPAFEMLATSIGQFCSSRD